jgi:chorismate mutase
MAEENKQNNDLDGLREDLNNLDNQLKELVKKRAEIAMNISVIKENSNLPIYQPSRELEILRRLHNSDHSPLNIRLVWNIWRSIINANTAIQAKLDIYVENNIEFTKRELILNNFGSQNNLIENEQPLELLAKENNKNNQIAVIDSNSPLIDGIEGDYINIISVLPLINFDLNKPSLYIIGKKNHINTNEDIFILKVVTEPFDGPLSKNKIHKISEIINQEIDYMQQISDQSILFALRYGEIDYDDLVIKIKSEKYVKTAAMIGQYAAPLNLRR